MEFLKYQHLERYGTDEVEGIDIGTVYVFPKLDGTNAVVWSDGVDIYTGSRNRSLSTADDNAGFARWVYDEDAALPVRRLALSQPGVVFYGEWLVPHSLKTYNDFAWRQLYLFDAFDTAKDRWLTYEEQLALYKAVCYEHYVPCIGKFTNPSYETLAKLRDTNTYLIQQDKGAGEGIVLKNYQYRNKFGRQTWAKMVTTHFKDAHIKEMGGAVGDDTPVEGKIAEKYLTGEMVQKIVEKIRVEQGAFGSRDIPRLLNTAYHDLVTEELWNALKEHKQPRVDFRRLSQFSNERVKQLFPSLFGR